MNNPEEPTGLEGVPAFQALDDTERRELAAKASLITLKSGELVVHETESKKSVYFIVRGRIRICKFTKEGKEIQYEDLMDGEMFGELAALEDKERTTNCIAISDVTLAVLKQQEFLAAMDSYRDFNRYVVRRLSSMLRKHIDRVYEYGAFTVKNRLRLELFRIAAANATGDSDIFIESPPTHADIAARIGTHREAITRELKSLEAIGVITWKPGKHIVHDIGYLSETT